MRISDWSSDVCSSDLDILAAGIERGEIFIAEGAPCRIAARGRGGELLAHRVAGRKRFQPGGEVRLLLRHAARPEAVDEETRAVARVDGVVYALDRDCMGAGHLYGYRRFRAGAQARRPAGTGKDRRHP